MTRRRKDKGLKTSIELTILLCISIIFGGIMSFFSDRPFKFIVGTLVLLFLLITVQNAYAPPLPPPPTYSITAHGNSTSGVNRNVVPTVGVSYPADGAYAVGHCGHCHEMHASIGGAEPPPTGDNENPYAVFKENYVANRNELCYACHEQLTLGTMPKSYGRYGIYQGKTTKYNASIHYSSGSMVWSPDPVPPGPPYNDAGNCHNCHNPHGYRDATGVIPSMLFARDSKTGDSPAYEMGCEACHDGTQGGASKDVKAQLNKTYKHPTHTYNDRHTLPETGQPSGSSFGPTNRHAECVDCHNPHTVVSATTHTAGTSGNAVSDVLKYVWGVEPTTWPSIWTQPTSFTVRKPPTYTGGSLYEYQICFKCHSYYGLGTLTNAVSTIIGPSFTNITDQAWEFNVNNKSAHPVVVATGSQTGATTPYGLATAQMSSTWQNVTTQTMYCSDCHGADNESTSAKGPHGSSVKHMLKGTGKYWPTQSDGITLWTKGDITTTGPADLFCRNCHPILDSSGWKNNAHSTSFHSSTIACIRCHIVVPHGGKMSRFIGDNDDTMPARYAYQSTISNMYVRKFTKDSSPTGYSWSNCYSSSSGCSKHDSSSYGTENW